VEISKAVSEKWDRLTGDRLPEYALHYYDALKAQFDTLEDPSERPGLADSGILNAYTDAKGVVEKAPADLGWTDLMLLDLSIIRTLSLECLRVRVAELRHRMGGNGVPLPPELSPKLESATAEHLPALRCEAEMLVTHLWQLRIARNSRDRYVGELRRTAFYGMVWIVLALIVVGSLAKQTPLYLIILAAGMLGALVSILRRLQAAAASVALNLDQGSDLSALAYERRAILISLLSGGVFAILLYVVFVAGLSGLAGDLAPQFLMPEKTPEGGMNFSTFVDGIGPQTGKDYAKVVVWSFAAGFFEQLVPDVLDRLVKRDSKQKQ